MSEDNKGIYFLIFFGALHVVWFLLWGVNLYLEIVPLHAHNPFVSMFSPYLIFILMSEPEFYNLSFWLEDTELMRPAIIFWLIASIGGFYIFKIKKYC